MTRSHALRTQISAWSSSLGFEVLTADSARQALNLKSGRRPIAAVMSELGTSRSTLALARRMRSCETVLALPPCVLLAASVSGFPEPYDDMRRAGFSGVLTSPPTFGGLRTRLGAAGLLHGSAAQRSRMQLGEAEAMFWTELGGDLDALKAAVIRMDALDSARWAHRIKGAALMFGKDALGDTAAKLERHLCDSPAPDMASAARMLERLVVLFEAHSSA